MRPAPRLTTAARARHCPVPRRCRPPAQVAGRSGKQIFGSERAGFHAAAPALRQPCRAHAWPYPSPSLSRPARRTPR
jgi:hypothetical protein